MAVSYAPRETRDASLAILALDARLGRMVGQANEVLLAQMRLAWWRDTLRQKPEEWPKGDPLLALISEEFEDTETLVGLVDGFEALLAEPPLTGDAVGEFIKGRAGVWRDHAARFGGQPEQAHEAASIWAIEEIMMASRVSASDEHAVALRRELPQSPPRLARSLRPLAVLTGLTIRANKLGERHLLGSRRSILAAYRLGMTGR